VTLPQSLQNEVTIHVLWNMTARIRAAEMQVPV